MHKLIRFYVTLICPYLVFQYDFYKRKPKPKLETRVVKK
jgi:hypothetical protein